MPEYIIGMPEFDEERDSDFAEFINLVAGRSVVSGGDWGPERLELGLSGEAMVRVFWTPAGLLVNLVSTTNPGEVPVLVVRFEDERRKLPARVVEQRVRALRSLYAVALLLQREDGERLGRLLTEDANADVEGLLAEQDQLYLEGFAPGSWYATLWTGVKENFRAVYTVALMVYSRGREAVLGKLEAERRLKDIEADKAEFELLKQKIDYGLELSKKVKDPQMKKAIHDRVQHEYATLLGPGADPHDAKVAADRMLEVVEVGDRRK